MITQLQDDLFQWSLLQSKSSLWGNCENASAVVMSFTMSNGTHKTVDYYFCFSFLYPLEQLLWQDHQRQETQRPHPTCPCMVHLSQFESIQFLAIRSECTTSCECYQCWKYINELRQQLCRFSCTIRFRWILDYKGDLASYD